MERRLEKEKKDIQDQLRTDIETVEHEEQAKYERKVEQMRKEIASQASSFNIEQELQQYREQLEQEYELQIREYKKQVEQQLNQEEQKLEKKRAQELKEYEQLISEQYEGELKRKQSKMLIQREAEEKELELVKLRIDQLY